MQLKLSQNSAPNINFAQIDFNEANAPHSLIFDDVYFSDAGGSEETRHVFISGNNILERLKNSNKEYFNIGETGFGSGLNLLTLIQTYNELSKTLDKKLPKLNFLTIEAFPMTFADMQKTLQQFPKLEAETKLLLAKYDDKLLKPGLNTIVLTDNITLHLIIDDVIDGFTKLEILDNDGIDAWFLDGFNPSNNVAMWSEDCAKLLFKLSNPQASIATFTVAGFVRRNLNNNGFTVKKVPGFGRKREMTVGIVNK